MSASKIAEARIGHHRLILWSRWSGAAGGWLLRHAAKPGPLGWLYKAPPCWHPPQPRPEYPTDEEAIAVDRIVSRLPEKRKYVIAARYLFRQRPDPEVLKAVGVSRRTWYYAIEAAILLLGVEKRRKEIYELHETG